MALRGRPKKLDFDALWSYALGVLGRRAHSAGELKQKLTRRAESYPDVDAILAKLRVYGFTDDRKFSESLAAARLQNQGFGRARVLRELNARRVTPSIAQRAVEDAFAGTDELGLVQQFLNRKYRGRNLAEFLSEEKNMANVYRRLRTAGFSSRAVLTVLKRHNHHAADFDEPEE